MIFRELNGERINALATCLPTIYIAGLAIRSRFL